MKHNAHELKLEAMQVLYEEGKTRREIAEVDRENPGESDL